MKIYTLEELQNKPLAQLKEIAKSLGAEPKQDARIKSNWVSAILGAMPVKVEELPSDKKVAEAKTCADCPLFQAFDDGSGRGLCCGADKVAREHHQQTQDCLHLIEAHEEEPSDTKVEDEYTLLPAGATKLQTAYHVKYQGQVIGMIFNVHRNNTWQCGDGQNYRYPAEAREALVRLTEAPLLKTSPSEYQSPDGALQIRQCGGIEPREKFFTNNKDKYYYRSWRDAEKGAEPVAIQFGDVEVGDKILIDSEARIVNDISQVQHLGINYTKLICSDGVEVKAPWYCQVQIAEAVTCVA